MPGVDLSFFYGSFLGVSANLEAVVFETVSFRGFVEIETIVDSLIDELSPDDGSGAWTPLVLTEVCDPDAYGAKYIFTRTPGCPACGSTTLATFTETQEPWPQAAGEATHDVWDRMDSQSKLIRIRAALGLDRPRLWDL